MKKALSFLFILYSFKLLIAQDCRLVLSGSVLDLHEDKPLEKAVVFIKEIKSYSTTDSSGIFYFKDLCIGTYHLLISHVGCTPKQQLIYLKGDTFTTIKMDHHIEHLADIQVKGKSWQNKVKIQDRIEQHQLQELSHKNFSEILEELPGVSTLRTGSGISKPIIQGLYGNRIALVNQGVVLSGQQWGNDHAPEIDAFTAEQIQVLKGASALRYGGGNLGSVIQLLPKKFTQDPHLHGKLNYNFNTNGRVHVVNALIEQSKPLLNWRLFATHKNGGDLHTPNYYLTNTGKRESNIALQLNKNIGSKWINDFSYSLFTSEMGLLRGSHIGNLTDLDLALKQTEPFFTQNEFSRFIAQPSQEVQHHLAIYNGKYVINEHHLVEIKSSWQWNARKEYDVRRAGRSELPALSLSQHTFWNEGIHTYTQQGKEWVSGIQHQFVNNTNVPETGILPLIPDYYQNYVAAFTTYKLNKNKWLYEAGLRGGSTQYQAYTITQTLPRELLVIPLQFFHTAGTLQASYYFSNKQTFTIQTGLTIRPPEIHELFSFGLHQGISSIEEGDPNLKQEQSWKSSVGWEFRPNNTFYFSVNTFIQQVENFIYLQPQEEFRLTIRGAFPVFVYEQQDALLLGGDVFIKALLNDHMEFVASYSTVRGQNIGLDIPLVYMPSDIIQSSLRYEWLNIGWLKQPSIQISGRYVAEQVRLLNHQDFIAPPPAYFLLGIQIQTDFLGKLKALTAQIRIENMLNTVYRDYLNRQRYFADEMGINIMMGLSYKF